MSSLSLPNIVTKFYLLRCADNGDSEEDSVEEDEEDEVTDEDEEKDGH
jgi:hypothetical protein